MAIYKDNLQRQNRVISGFGAVVRSEARRIASGELNFIEREILQSAKRTAAMSPQNEKPRISFYNPNNPLNGINGKSKAEQKAIIAKIKSDAKAAKLA